MAAVATRTEKNIVLNQSATVKEERSKRSIGETYGRPIVSL